MKIFSSKKRVAAIGAITAATLVGGGVAYAFWTTSGSGTGSASTASGDANYTVLVSAPVAPVVPLAPGEGVQNFNVTVTNPGPGVRSVTAVTVSVADENGDPWSVSGPNGGCDASDFSLNGAGAGVSVDLVATSLDLNGGDTSSNLPVAITMVNKATENQDDCKGVPVPLYALAS